MEPPRDASRPLQGVYSLLRKNARRWLMSHDLGATGTHRGEVLMQSNNGCQPHPCGISRGIPVAVARLVLRSGGCGIGNVGTCALGRQ